MSTTLDDSVGFDEPTDTPMATAATAHNVAIINQDIGRVQNALSEFDRVSAGLALLQQQYPKDVVYDVTTAKGMKDAIEHRAAWRDPRILVEKARKMAKAPLLALGKNIDARAAWLTDKLLEGEQPVDQQIKAEEARKEAEKQARIQAEFGRVQAIQEAIAEIHMDAMAVIGKPSEFIEARLMSMTSVALDPLVFQEQMPQAEAARAQAIAKLEQALKAKRWDEEQESKRLAAEEEQRKVREAEAARVRAQAEENARLAAELAEQRRALEQQAAELAAARAESDRLEKLAEENRAALAEQANRIHQADEHAALAAVVPAAATITQDAQERGSMPADAPAYYASNEPEAAGLPSGHEGAAAPAKCAAISMTAEGLTAEDWAALQAGTLDLTPGPLAAPTIDVVDPDTDDLPLVLSPLAEAAIRALLAHIEAEFTATKFPSQPKPSPAWWADLRQGAAAVRALMGVA